MKFLDIAWRVVAVVIILLLWWSIVGLCTAYDKTRGVLDDL